MKRLGIISVILIAVFIWWITRSLVDEASTIRRQEVKAPPAAIDHSTSTNSAMEAERKKETLERVTKAYNTPITFAGRVIDQYGNPVSGARVSYGAIDQLLSKGSDYNGFSDANGNFSINGIKGIALTVGVWKEGYYGIDGKSAATFAYGINADNSRRLPPTPDTPTIFVLHKMGESEPLVHVERRQYKVAKNGQPMEIDLDTGKQVGIGEGDIKFERSANDLEKNESGHFDWSFRISVPNGGIMERKDQFEFEAPQKLYVNAAEIRMPASLGSKWSYVAHKSYFVKIADGRYARINTSIYGGHTNSLVLETFINPNRQSRNLEFDPSKVVQSDPQLDDRSR